jgi:hypothetical protein
MFWSGCPDLNRGPLRPERSALTKLRHSPSIGVRRETTPGRGRCYPTEVGWLPALFGV